jgi:diguanylate cyclase (GGDEF)-like protein
MEELVCFRLARSDGSWRHLEAIGKNLLDDPAVAGIVLTARDRTERHEAEQRLAHRALHDPLTELPNRTLFFDRLEQALYRASRSPGSVAVMFIDVDRFKVINDSLGHEAGDEVIRAVAALLESSVRPGDTVARFGGDEFVVCCEEVADAASARAIAERFAQRLQRPFGIAGREFAVTLSIGIALTGHHRDARADDLLRLADAAMYRVKERGGDGFEVATGTELDPDILDQLDLEGGLRRAIENEGLRVHYQPEIDLTTGAVVGFEALLRWEDPHRGSVPPMRFIPLAEQTGLIVPLGRWVLEAACRQVAEWQARQGPDDAPLWVSVNLSGRQLAEPDVADHVASALAASGLDGGSLWLEITETVLMTDVDAATRTLEALRALGVHIAVDDFGTGWSSLLYLKRFPVEALKIDRSFVDGLGRDRDDTSIVAAVVSLAHSLGLLAVAEGVETEEQLDGLRALDCDLGQGFRWARPMTPDQVTAWLAGLPKARAGAGDARVQTGLSV